jgi:FMN-dependent NADH-azoreductase
MNREMKLLHIDASARHSGSRSRELSQYFVDAVLHQVNGWELVRLDLAIDLPPHVTALSTEAQYTQPEDRTPEMNKSLERSDAYCCQLLAADAVVIGTPMYNFSMPSVLKAYIDNIVRRGLTYGWNGNHQIMGKLGHQRFLFITARGADYRCRGPYQGQDGLTPALRYAFAFIGVRNMQFVDCQPTHFASIEEQLSAIRTAKLELDEIASDWSSLRFTGVASI